MLQVQQLDERHVADLVALSARLGWDYTAEEIHVILSAGVAYGHLDADGRVISSAAIFPYGELLSSVGMVMVDPAHRRKGLGSAVTQRVLQAVPDIPAMLVATALGQPLYESIGFHTVGTLHKYMAERYVQVECDALSLPAEYRLSPLTPDDFEDILRLDTAALGAERREFLRLRVEQAVEGVVLHRRKHASCQSEDTSSSGEAIGYALAVQGSNYHILGPVVAPDADLALALIEHLASRQEGRLRIDVPTEQTALVDTLPARGFVLANVPPVMLMRADQLPPRQGTLFAIAAQAYG